MKWRARRSTVTRSACLPTSRVPTTSPSPRARAPDRVAMSRMSQGSPTVGSSVDTFCSSDANFISENRSRVLFSFSPSDPRPTSMPASRYTPIRAGPDASFMFEHGQWASAVPVCAQICTSRSSSHTPWATTAWPSRMPRSWNTSRGRRPKRRNDSCTSQIDSLEWVWSPTSNSAARAAASRNIWSEQ